MLIFTQPIQTAVNAAAPILIIGSGIVRYTAMNAITPAAPIREVIINLSFLSTKMNTADDNRLTRCRTFLVDVPEKVSFKGDAVHHVEKTMTHA